MRQGQNNSLLLNEAGQVVAVNLGADFCAEHEWGIKQIKSSFDFGNESKLGLERRKITSSVPMLWLDKVEYECFVRPRGRKVLSYAGFFFDRYTETVEDAVSYVKRQAYASADKDLVTLWSESDFCALAHKPEQIAQLKEIYDAFPQKDIAIWLGGGGVFQNAGLVIAIASRLSKEITDSWYEADEDHRKLIAEVLDTGIEVKLKKAGKNYFALSPQRQKDGSIRFWLNPTNQKENNWGWYTVQDLEEWCENKGPVPKVK